jgi:hypothetical protein
MDQVMTEQVEVLRNQMASIEELPSDPGYGQSIAAHPSHPAAIKRGLYRGPAVGPPHPGPQDVPM